MNTTEYDFETPFVDQQLRAEDATDTDTNGNQYAFNNLISPFQSTFQEGEHEQKSQYADEYMELLSELEDSEFHESLYEVATEMEDSWGSKISNEMAMGTQFVPYALKQGRAYYAPMLRESDRLLDAVAEHFSGNDLAEHGEVDVELFFETLELNNEGLSPIQEQFLGGLVKKVKSVVKKGVDLAKKGIRFAGKFLPMNLILGKLKRLIRPLLEKVLKSLIGKLPSSFRPHARSLAKKFLKLENADDSTAELGDFEGLQLEFDTTVSQLLFTSEEQESEIQLEDYENSFENLERSEGYEGEMSNTYSLEAAKDTFLNDLKNLGEDEDPTPVIERFLPVAIMALKPVIKLAIATIGRKKIINFLAGLLSGLIKKYVPSNVSRPLAARIIDLGLRAIGFETAEADNSDLAYEALANTIDETITDLNSMDSQLIGDQEELAMHLYESFEKAAANNFPPNYIRPNLRATNVDALWISMPRKNPIKVYKKFTNIFDVTIDQKLAKGIKIFRSVPLANFLRDKYGLEVNNGIKAKVHIYELGRGGRLSMISKFENLPGLSPRIPKAWVQLLPLTKEVSQLLLKENNLGTRFSKKSLTSRYHAKPGQRFYYLDIEGARLRLPQNKSKNIKSMNPGPKQIESRSADVQAVLNFNKSQIKINYFFSEEDAKDLAGKITKNDVLGTATTIKNSVRNILNTILKGHLSEKVKIIHESVPEMYLEADEVGQDQFINVKDIGRNIGKNVISKMVQKLTETIAFRAYEAVVAHLKSRPKVFIDAQSQPQDGVTISIIWNNMSGMSVIKSAISAINGKGSIPNLGDLKLPNFTQPDVVIKAGKLFD